MYEELGPPTELQLHFQVAKLLREHCTWMWTHIPSGEKRDPKTAVKLKQMGLRKGWPDFILIAPILPRPSADDRSAHPITGGIAHFLELKGPTGKLSFDQHAFKAYCTEHGIPFETAHTFAEATDALSFWGCLNVKL